MRYPKLYPVVVLAFAVLLAACGGQAPAPVPTPAPGQATQAPAAQAAPAQSPIAPAATNPLVGKVWQWTKTAYNDGRTINVPSPASYTLEFKPAGLVNVKADCNNASGAYTLSGNNLSIQLGPMTMAACPPGSLSDEFVKELGQVAQYQLAGEALSLSFQLNNGAMTFTSGQAVVQPAQPTPAVIPGMDLGGWVWQWTKTTYSDGRTVTPSNPADYTLVFSMSDGKAVIKADCNDATGDFMTDGQNLEIMIGATTRAMCAPESLSDEYLKELSEAASYKVDGNTLSLYFPSNGGTMTFTAGPAALQPAPPPLTVEQATAQAAQPAQPVGPNADLGGPTWKWVKTVYNNGSVVTAPDPNKYTLTFKMDQGRFLFVADCNNGSGSFTLNGQQLAMTVEGMTRAYCPPPSDDYIRQLGQVASYAITGNTLSLALKNNSGTLTFTTDATPLFATPTAVSAPPASGTPSAVTGPDVQRLTSGVWKWVKSIDNSGKDWTPANPANYTVQFKPDGTAAIKADCNDASGAYTANNGLLTIQIGPMTMAACPPPTFSSEFVQQLGRAGSYFFDGNSLIIEWQMDSGSMRLEQ